MAALMLVLLTSLALSGVLFDLASAYSIRLLAIKEDQHRQSARKASLLCRDMLLVQLSENARFTPISGISSSFIYNEMSCYITSFNSSFSSGNNNEEIKTAVIEGQRITGTSTLGTNKFTIESKITVSNLPGSVPLLLYTKEVSES